jgi:hypothetical protein
MNVGNSGCPPGTSEEPTIDVACDRRDRSPQSIIA